MNASNDNIVALATAPGIGAIGVIRISGPDALKSSIDFLKAKTYWHKKAIPFIMAQ